MVFASCKCIKRNLRVFNRVPNGPRDSSGKARGPMGTRLNNRNVETIAMQSKAATEAEFSILEVLWECHQEGATIREIVVAIYGRHEHSLHAGVKSLLDRLMDKGLVAVDKSGFAHRFEASIDRSEFVGRELKQMAESHFGGSLRPLLLSLVEQAKLTRKDRAAIEKLIENMKE
jgi:predicted transcriptional regulator